MLSSISTEQSDCAFAIDQRPPEPHRIWIRFVGTPEPGLTVVKEGKPNLAPIGPAPVLESCSFTWIADDTNPGWQDEQGSRLSTNDVGNFIKDLL